MRKLASIQRIEKLEAIEGADLILKATVLNWSLVTAKDNGFKEGDMIVFVEPDAWVPHALAPFLSKGQEPREYNGVKGERLRTVRLRGQVSQGLILPFSSINSDYDWLMGDDVSCQLGIQKYEPPVPACLSGVVKGAFPSVFPKTDEDRIQTFTNEEWTAKKQFQYEITEKLEGSSMSVGMIAGEFVVCSRKLNLMETEGNTLWKMARKYEIEAKMKALALDNLIIQGEVIGEGVQGNYYDIKGQDFYVFAIYDAGAGQYVSPNLRMKMCDTLALKHVPMVEECFEFMQEATVPKILDFADGQSALNPKKLREGIVFKRIGGQEHFKAVSPRYLVKNS